MNATRSTSSVGRTRPNSSPIKDSPQSPRQKLSSDAGAQSPSLKKESKKIERIDLKSTRDLKGRLNAQGEGKLSPIKEASISESRSLIAEHLLTASSLQSNPHSTPAKKHPEHKTNAIINPKRVVAEGTSKGLTPSKQESPLKIDRDQRSTATAGKSVFDDSPTTDAPHLQTQKSQGALPGKVDDEIAEQEYKERRNEIERSLRALMNKPVKSPAKSRVNPQSQQKDLKSSHKKLVGNAHGNGLDIKGIDLDVSRVQGTNETNHHSDDDQEINNLLQIKDSKNKANQSPSHSRKKMQSNQLPKNMLDGVDGSKKLASSASAKSLLGKNSSGNQLQSSAEKDPASHIKVSSLFKKSAFNCGSTSKLDGLVNSILAGTETNSGMSSLNIKKIIEKVLIGNKSPESPQSLRKTQPSGDERQEVQPKLKLALHLVNNRATTPFQRVQKTPAQGSLTDRASTQMTDRSLKQSVFSPTKQEGRLLTSADNTPLQTFSTAISPKTLRSTQKDYSEHEKISSASRDMLKQIKAEKERLAKTSLRRTKYYCYCEQRYKTEEIRIETEAEPTPMYNDQLKIKNRLRKKPVVVEPEPEIEISPPKFSELSFTTRGVIWDITKKAKQLEIEEAKDKKEMEECTFNPQLNAPRDVNDIPQDPEHFYERNKKWLLKLNARKMMLQDFYLSELRKPNPSLRSTFISKTGQTSSGHIRTESDVWNRRLDLSPHRMEYIDLLNQATDAAGEKNREAWLKLLQSNAFRESVLNSEIRSLYGHLNNLGQVVQYEERAQTDRALTRETEWKCQEGETNVDNSPRKSEPKRSKTPEKKPYAEARSAKKLQQQYSAGAKKAEGERLDVVKQFLTITKKFEDKTGQEAAKTKAQ